MKIIAGLGNPGDKYVGTRHNIGYDVLDRIALDCKIDIHERKFKGLVGSGYIEGEKVVLVKPLTYMNLSGECIQEVTSFYKIDVTEENSLDTV